MAMWVHNTIECKNRTDFNTVLKDKLIQQMSPIVNEKLLRIYYDTPYLADYLGLIKLAKKYKNLECDVECVKELMMWGPDDGVIKAKISQGKFTITEEFGYGENNPFDDFDEDKKEPKNNNYKVVKQERDVPF